MTDDELYGPSAEAGGTIGDAEREFSPRSLTLLNRENSAVLVEFMAVTEANTLANSAMQRMPILWVMRRGCDIYFAMEEVVDLQTGAFYHSLPKGTLRLPEGRVKLGHPSLLDRNDKTARIGGEILYDPDPISGVNWIISNSSGRYGRRIWQTEAHLRAVAGIFTSFGLSLRVEFDR